jgi:glutathione S-transferase
MLTICHLSSSRSERIVWLMEELGLPYTIDRYQREPGGAAPAALQGVHALGRAPVIRDGDTVLAESGAIVDYIVHRHGGGRLAIPAEQPAYARYLYWLHFAEGSLMSLLLIALVLSRVPEASASAVTARVRARNGQHAVVRRCGVGGRALVRRRAVHGRRRHDDVPVHDDASVPRLRHRTVSEHRRLPATDRRAARRISERWRWEDPTADDADCGVVGQSA